MNSFKNAPKYSIILPTRGRSFYVGNTIKSVLYQDYENYELIIVDNNEDDQTFLEIQKYKSNKIRYFKTGNLPMWENWNFGYKQSIGEFIMILTDRSLLYSRDALSYLNDIISQVNYDVFTWPLIVATESEDFRVETQVLWGLGNDQNIVLTKQDYKKFITIGQWDKYGMSAPKGFNSCISRDLCSKIVNTYGSLYMPLSPDYSHSFMVLSSCEQVLHLSQPLIISANLKDSYESKVKAIQSNENFYKQYGVSKEQSTEFCPIKSDVTIGWNTVYNDLYKVMLIQEGLIEKDRIFRDAFLMSTLKYYDTYTYNEDSVQVIHKAISMYLDFMCPTIDPVIRQELSVTIGYIFYKNNELCVEEIVKDDILSKPKKIFKIFAKRSIHFLFSHLKKKEEEKKQDIFSIFVQNSIL